MPVSEDTLLNALQTQRALQDLNTLAVPSTARYYFEAHSIAELQAALSWSKQQRVAVAVLGGGSNLILPDFVDALVLRPRLEGIDLEKSDDDFVYVRVGAGEQWHQFVCHCLDNAWYGLENLALIPGSVGAAPIQNIGAYGVEVSDFVVELEALDRQTASMVSLSNRECQFGYRDSCFKGRFKDKFIITSVLFKLRRKPQVNIAYLQTQVHNCNADPDPRWVFDTVLALRKSKLPDPVEQPNVGSFFKNPYVPQSQYRELLTRFPGLVAYNVQDKQVKLAAAWLIDQLGWRGREKHGARVHARQALVLTNPHKRPAQAVLSLAEEIKQEVFARYGVLLEQEPQWLSWHQS